MLQQRLYLTSPSPPMGRCRTRPLWDENDGFGTMPDGKTASRLLLRAPAEEKEKAEALCYGAVGRQNWP